MCSGTSSSIHAHAFLGCYVSSARVQTNNKFSTIATTLSGDVAVGADDGQIRLYNSSVHTATLAAWRMLDTYIAS